MNEEQKIINETPKIDDTGLVELAEKRKAEIERVEDMAREYDRIVGPNVPSAESTSSQPVLDAAAERRRKADPELSELRRRNQKENIQLPRDSIGGLWVEEYGETPITRT